MSLAFRNLTVSPDDDVEQWGVEGILTAIERGTLTHMRRVLRVALASPWSAVADELLEAASLTDHPLAARMAAQVREARGGDEATVARRIRGAIAYSGLSSRELAGPIGTSASRLSTYASGKVQPSAAMLPRIERVAAMYSRAEPKCSSRDPQSP